MSAMTTFPVIPRAAGGVLIASPSRALREQVSQRLNGRWRPVQQALGGAEALLKLEERDWQVLFLDRRLPDLDSEELIAIIQRRFPGIQVVLLDSDAAFPAGDSGLQDPDEPASVSDRAHEEGSWGPAEASPVKDKNKDKD
jgi:CheY-like chemotaxis protein